MTSWTVICFWTLLTNQIHKWSHTYKPPALVIMAQNCGLILSRKNHGVHHRPPFDKYYCITNGWLNPVLAYIVSTRVKRYSAVVLLCFMTVSSRVKCPDMLLIEVHTGLLASSWSRSDIRDRLRAARRRSPLDWSVAESWCGCKSSERARHSTQRPSVKWLNTHNTCNVFMFIFLFKNKVVCY